MKGTPQRERGAAAGVPASALECDGRRARTVFSMQCDAGGRALGAGRALTRGAPAQEVTEIGLEDGGVRVCGGCSCM